MNKAGAEELPFTRKATEAMYSRSQRMSHDRFLMVVSSHLRGISTYFSISIVRLGIRYGQPDVNAFFFSCDKNLTGCDIHFSFLSVLRRFLSVLFEDYLYYITLIILLIFQYFLMHRFQENLIKILLLKFSNFLQNI